MENPKFDNVEENQASVLFKKMEKMTHQLPPQKNNDTVYRLEKSR